MIAILKTKPYSYAIAFVVNETDERFLSFMRRKFKPSPEDAKWFATIPPV